MEAVKDILSNEKFTVMPGVYDCLSAKLAEHAGAKVLFLSGGALSVASLGRPDIGFLNLTEFADAAQKITSTINIPLISDADNGFGNAIHTANAAKTFERIGIAGMQIDDQVLPQSTPTTSKECLDWAYAKAKIFAVRESVSSDFVLIFRTIANIAGDFNEALARANKATQAGADYVYIDGLKSLEEVEKVAHGVDSNVKLLINMNEKGAAARVPIQQIKSLGYKIGLFPVSSMAVAAKSMYDMLSDLMTQESTISYRDKMLNPTDIYNMVGLTSLTESAQKLYD